MLVVYKLSLEFFNDQILRSIYSDKETKSINFIKSDQFQRKVFFQNVAMKSIAND
jgi:hypothetical protein